MKIAMMAQAGSVHTTRWSQGLAQRGHRVWVISNSRFKSESSEVETIYLPGYSMLAYVKNMGRVKKVLRSLKPELVHSHYATGYGLWGTMAARVPLVVTVWGTDVEDALKGRFMIRPVVRRALRRARMVTSPSKYLMDRTIGLEASVAGKIVQVPFGVAIPEISTIKLVKDIEGVIHVIYAKTYRPAYAPEIALEAFALACREDRRLRLTMIGGGPMQRMLRELAEKLGISERANIRGWQDTQETSRLIESADIMLMPSRRESFGVSALEASAKGVPVVASKVGGLPEIIEDNVNGLLVPPEDVGACREAILKLAADRQLRQRMGQAGQQMAREKYDFEKCLDRMEEVYRRAMGS